MDDIALIKRIGQGDKRAMHALYERYHNHIYAFAMSRVRNSELASDCVHDTMIEVWRSAQSFEGRSAVRTWLFSISRNKLIDALRKQSKMSYVGEVPDQEDTKPDPEAAAIAASERELLHHCCSIHLVGCLSTNKRSFFVLLGPSGP